MRESIWQKQNINNFIFIFLEHYLYVIIEETDHLQDEKKLLSYI